MTVVSGLTLLSKNYKKADALLAEIYGKPKGLISATHGLAFENKKKQR